MSLIAVIIATFTNPQSIGTTPESILWMFPLAAAIAIVYKATKLPKIEARNFIKESFVLFASIVVFLIATAISLCILAWLILE